MAAKAIPTVIVRFIALATRERSFRLWPGLSLSHDAGWQDCQMMVETTARATPPGRPQLATLLHGRERRGPIATLQPDVTIGGVCAAVHHARELQ